MNEEEQQQIFFEFQMYQQKAGQIEEQIKAVDKQINEMGEVAESLSILGRGKQKSLLPIGKGIFIKSETDNPKLLVNIGSGIIVEKTPTEAEKLINTQIQKLGGMKEHQDKELENLHHQMEELIMKIQQ